MARATCCCDSAARSAPSPTSRLPTCSAAPSRARLCATRSYLSEQRRSEHAKWWRHPRYAVCRHQSTGDGRRQPAAADFLRRSPVGTVLDSATALVLGVGLAVVVTTAGVTAGVAAAAMVLVGLWWSSVSLLSSGGLFMSPLLPALSVLSALAAMTFAKFTVERRRAETAGREKTTAQRLMIQTLLSLTEVRDAETGRHSRRTQLYARLLAEQLSRHPDFRDYLTPERIDLLSSLAPLHDIGKVGIPDHILNKPGALTTDELREMRKHPTLGREVILKAEQRVDVRDDATLAMAKDIVYTHHERWDGTGYPQGLRGSNIPIAGRVMAIVDVYDAGGSTFALSTVDFARRRRAAHYQRQGLALRSRSRRSICRHRAVNSDCRPRRTHGLKRNVLDCPASVLRFRGSTDRVLLAVGESLSRRLPARRMSPSV